MCVCLHVPNGTRVAIKPCEKTKQTTREKLRWQLSVIISDANCDCSRFVLLVFSCLFLGVLVSENDICEHMQRHAFRCTPHQMECINLQARCKSTPHFRRLPCVSVVRMRCRRIEAVNNIKIKLHRNNRTPQPHTHTSIHIFRFVGARLTFNE